MVMKERANFGGSMPQGAFSILATHFALILVGSAFLNAKDDLEIHRQ
jgi:hypothetical protein